MPLNRIKLFVLGTCRAFHISKKACKGHYALLNRTGLFLHSTKEILNIVNDETRSKIPEDMYQYAGINDLTLQGLQDADIVAVEISSNRCLKYKGNMYKYVGSNIPNKHEGTSYVMSVQEIIDDMVCIAKDLGKPVVFIAHINVSDDGLNPFIAQRKHMADVVRKGAAKTNSYFFNPGDHLGEDWRTYVDEPVYHYTEEGDKYMGKKFLDYLHGVMKNEKWQT